MSGFGWSTNGNQIPTFPAQPVQGIPAYPTLPTAPAVFPQQPTTMYCPPGMNYAGEPQVQHANYAATYASGPKPKLYGDSDSDDYDVRDKGPMVPGYYWAESSVEKKLPQNAIQGGTDMDGSKIYIGLSKFQGDELPAKVIPEKKAAYVSHGGKEHSVKEYKVLCQHSLIWVKNSGGKIPKGAVPAGRSASGETLYVGRTSIQGSVTVGKIHPSCGCLYIPFGGEEHSFKDYEILVLS